MATKPWGSLPMSRVNTIMKSSSDAENIGKVSSYMMTKATELFIKTLAQESYKLAKSGKKLDYKHVSEVVNRDERYEFLRDIMPKKITVAEYKKIMAKQEQNDAGTSSDDETGSEGSDQTSDSDSE